MAVIKAKSKKVIESFVPLVSQSLIAPHVVTRLSGDLFKGAEGDSVTLRLDKLRTKAREYEWRTRTAPIVMDDISGGEELIVKIDTHVYTATGLTDEHMTLDDINFVREVMKPQVEAIAGDYEARVVAGLRAVDAKHTLDLDVTADPYLVALEAKRLMDSEKTAPTSGRVLLVGDNVAAVWLASDRLSRYDSTGQSGTPALREAVIGKLAGTPVVHVPELGPNEAYYQHQSSIVLANVAPVIPRGVIAGASATQDNYGMRWIADYDAMYLRDRSIISSFLGMNEIKDERWLTAGTHDPVTGVEGAGVDHEAGDIKPAAVAKNVRIIPITLTGFSSLLD